MDRLHDSGALLACWARVRESGHGAARVGHIEINSNFPDLVCWITMASIRCYK